MSSGWFALAGVLVGALVTGGINYALQVRGERRELRAAARLVLQELTNAATALRYAVERDIRGLLEHALSEDEWDRHHLLLARHLTDDQWDAVALGYGKAGAVTLLSDGDNADRSWHADVGEILSSVNRACQVLRARAHRKNWEEPDL